MVWVTAPKASIDALIWISGGTRIFRPLMSSGLLTACLELLRARKPHSKLATISKPMSCAFFWKKSHAVVSSVR